MNLNALAAQKAPLTVQPQAIPFEASDVRLLDGPFKVARDTHAKYLLSLDADRLLSKFRSEAGLEPKAKPYGGWEAQGIAGHSMGHYLAGCAKMYAGTGDEKFKERVAYIVSELAEVQKKWGDGYVAAIPDGRRVFDEVSHGDIRSKGFDLNGLWVPWYTHHKLMAGLRDSYEFCGNEQAKEVLIGLADYALKVTDKLDDKQLNTMLRCEQGGMSETAADVYAITGDKKYLELARRFTDHQVIDPLSKGEDRLNGLHANTQVPKLIGMARLHELLPKDEALGNAAKFFWKTVTENHTYANGGNSLNEHFGPPRVLAGRLRGNTSETCNTYNMLRLSRKLYSWNADTFYLDYYERAMFNHILASQNHSTAGVTYYVPLSTGSAKPFQGLDDAFTCCVGTGMENHASYGDTIYAHKDSILYVNLFIASELEWKEKGVKLTQNTDFPASGTTKLTITCENPVEIELRLRQPRWADEVKYSVNGKWQNIESMPGYYNAIKRTWKSGDTIEISMPLTLRSEPAPDNASKVALFYGPILLAGDLGDKKPSPAKTPRIVSESNDPTQWVKSEGELLFTTTKDVPTSVGTKVIPFYAIQDQHYLVYWDRYSAQDWAKYQDELKNEEERLAAIEKATVDFFQPGEMQPERDHNFDGEKIRTGTYENRKWRDAFDGGWFAFDMKIDRAKKNQLIVTYWGGDDGPRAFDIFVNDIQIASQELHNPRPGEWWDKAYEIPVSAIREKDVVRVKFKARDEKSVAGGLYGCRTVRN